MDVSRKKSRRPGSGGRSTLRLESLEPRLALSASVEYGESDRVVRVTGTTGSDALEVNQQGTNLVITVRSDDGVVSRTFAAHRIGMIRFDALAGDDTFYNRSWIPSQAFGGDGNDILQGGASSDRLFGGEGDDLLQGGWGNDVLRGQGGNDRLESGVGRDWLFGGKGDDRLFGGPGNDKLTGENGADELHGGDGDDLMRGRAGDDSLFGDAGNDSLFGDEDDDDLDGGTGHDRLRGGIGLDRERDSIDSFEDGDDDHDGYDNDHDRSPTAVVPVVFNALDLAQLTGTTAGKPDGVCYSLTLQQRQQLNVTIQAGANGRYPEVSIRDSTARMSKVFKLEPSESGLISGSVVLDAGRTYVIEVDPDSDTPAEYLIDLELVSAPVTGAPTVPTVDGGVTRAGVAPVVFDATGFAQVSGLSRFEDDKRFYTFTAPADTVLHVAVFPGATGRYADLSIRDVTTRRELLELEPHERRGQTGGRLSVFAGHTYVVEVKSPYDRVAVDFIVNLKLV